MSQDAATGQVDIGIPWSSIDAGSLLVDAGVSRDSGAATDAGVLPDAGATDASVTPDASVKTDAGPGNWTLSADSDKSCPPTPPDFPVVPCLGIYFGCHWKNTSGAESTCICDWIHTLCI